MKPSHVLQWANARIEKEAEKLNTLELAYAEMAIEYENKWFSKLFNLKYELSTWSDSWYDIHSYKLSIRELKDIIKESTYKSKMSYAVMDIKPSWHRCFYSWCEINNVPY